MLGKVFKAYDVRGVYPQPLDESVAWKVGYGTGRFLQQSREGWPAVKKPQHVAVGRDMRPHSPPLAEALILGLRATGLSVLDLGMVDTSFIYYAINELDCLGGVQTTASHNPIEYNGFKISGPKALPIGADSGLGEIRKIAETAGDAKPPITGEVEPCDLWDGYIRHVRKFMNVHRPLKVAVDASNGMAAAFVPRIFQGVKDLTLIPLNMQITGRFSHDPNPLVAENMRQTQEAVRTAGADFGVCFDGDADRCILCDERGSIIGCDLLGALFTPHFLQASPGSAIIYDLRSSKALAQAITAAGGRPVRGKVGHVFMKKLMREHAGVFGAELSGHLYYRDNFYTDSGAITFATAISVVSASDQPLSERVRPLMRYAQSGEMNFRTESKEAALAELKARYGPRGMVDELDGVTIDAFDREGWWVNVRASNTEPLLRMNLEARDRPTADRILREITPMLGQLQKGH